MINWQGTGEERLLSWRQFRLELSELPTQKAIEQINAVWSFCPFVSKYLSPHDTTQWPDPWTLISEGKFCNLARGLGMLYTASLSPNFESSDISIDIYNSISGERFDLVRIDNTILNYAHNVVIYTDQIDSELMLQCSYSKVDLNVSDFK
jgi:hypothetical protein